MTILLLFLRFFAVGAVSFGGGYGALPLLRSTTLSMGWLTEEQFADVVALAEVTPGPVALNAASYAGASAAGFAGAVAATLGYVLPSCLLTALMAVLWRRYRQTRLYAGIMNGLRPAVCALIFSASLTLLLSALGGRSVRGLLAGEETPDAVGALLFLGAFLLARTGKIPPAALILLAGLSGAVLLV